MISLTADHQRPPEDGILELCVTTEIENPFDLGEGVRDRKLHESMEFRLGLLADAAARALSVIPDSPKTL